MNTVKYTPPRYINYFLVGIDGKANTGPWPKY